MIGKPILTRKSNYQVAKNNILNNHQNDELNI